MFKAKDHQKIFNQVSDDARKFPQKAFEHLKDLNILSADIIRNTHAGRFHGSTNNENFYDLLFELGRGDLSVGRIYEGHLNALLLIDMYGSLHQKKKYFEYAAQGKLFGIWNTEIREDNLKLIKIKDKLQLKGAKTYCSGSLHIDYPIVTANTQHGVQMIILQINNPTTLKEDWTFWNPSGMRASVSSRIDFTGWPITEQQFLGKAGDYYQEPHFSWGAVRFSAVQLGAARAIADIMITDLKKTHRTRDPYQQMRLGEVAILMENSQLWLEKAKRLDQETTFFSFQEEVHFAHMMRTQTLDICEKTIALAEKSIGMKGMMMNHPLERKARDLRVYLKQAAPDATLAHVGDYFANRKELNLWQKIILLLKKN